MKGTISTVLDLVVVGLALLVDPAYWATSTGPRPERSINHPPYPTCEATFITMTPRESEAIMPFGGDYGRRAVPQVGRRGGNRSRGSQAST